MKIFAVGIVLMLSISFLPAGSIPEGNVGVVVLSQQGRVECSKDGVNWIPAIQGNALVAGMRLRTALASSADLLLQYNGSVFRLAAESELRVEKLKRMDTGLGMVTETRLNVAHGALVGSQRKLHKPSILEIATPHGKAVIRGTEYVVNAQGAVSVLTGSVDVIYNLPGNQGSVRVTVPAGSTFDPATATVVPTQPEHLQNVIADVDAVRQNAEVYRVGAATIVVKPENEMSPYTPNGNNGVGNGIDPQPPGNPPINDGPGTGPGNPGNQGGVPLADGRAAAPEPRV